MRRSLGPLLCELHAHTRWSDGALTVSELVDLHGRNGFDVLCVSDHVIRSDDPWRWEEGRTFSFVDEASWPSYLDEIELEAERAWAAYGMLVVPGLELTFNDDEPVMAAHAVAVGLREFVSVDDGIAEAMRTATEAGAAIIAAHPNGDEPEPVRGRLTKRFSRDAGLRRLVHRFELFNRAQLFGWVAEAGLPAVACGDFHREEHLCGWKTLLPSRHDETSVVDYLRSHRPVYLARLEADPSLLAA
jgi:3',5'-nucleoside bisphosphate phosphatase